ncbi:MAG: HAD-IIA family hydrolase [Phycisphaerae bacterium]
MKVRGLLLDVEGVLVADKRYQAVEGAVDFVRQAHAANCPLRLITNNTTDDKPAIIEKLRRAGFAFTLDELHTCTAAAVNRLNTLRARRCLVLGSDALRRMFVEAGFEVADETEVDAVVVGLDTGLTYERLRLACDAIVGHKAAFLALHRNRLYTDAAGRLSPSVGPTVAAIECATQTEPVVTGKPSPDYFRRALDEIRVSPADVLVVSDDPFSDLAGAKRMGMQAALVLSGKYRDGHVVQSIPATQRPDVIVPRIGELLTTGLVQL